MNQKQAIRTLRLWDQQGRYVFTKHEFQKLFPQDNEKALSESLARLVKAGLLQRACRNVYINPNAASLDRYVLERIAKALRAGEYSYTSLESTLSEHGIISQIPINHLTIMTTGRSGKYKTPYGVIEMTHTKRSIQDILEHTLVIKGKPLRVATKETALRDLKRVGRNVHLVQTE